MFINVKVANGLNRRSFIADSTDTLRSVFNKADVNPNGATLGLNGSGLEPGDLDATFEEMGVDADCILTADRLKDNGSTNL